MKVLAFLAVSIIALPLVHCNDAHSSAHGLRITTSSGVLTGTINSTAPFVRQFLGIPYALPPTGPRRWLPPTGYSSSTPLLANDVGPACAQLPLRNAWVYSVNGGNRTEWFPIENYSEDCLTLNVWTPRGPARGLPVIIWFFGGGFVQGGTSSLYFNPKSWVERTREHIVVTVNYRTNIFGFPNAPGLIEQNLGLLDQRAALEWLRHNIESFGGDPLRMVKWSESGGAIGSDFLNFVNISDPIVSGMILSSGTALFPAPASISSDSKQTNFAFVANAVGCGDAAATIDCMRKVSWQTIEGVMSTNTSLTFLPTVDGRTIFSNYTAKYAAGNFSSIPAMIGTNQQELNALIPQIPGLFQNTTRLDLAGNASFLCESAVEASKFRKAAKRTTYRYRYDGVFPNISPPEYPGAFHASDLPLIFGTAADYHGASTAYEDFVGQKLQDLYLAFAKDPEKGLKEEGWASYADGKAVLLGGSSAPMKQIEVSALDDVCSTFQTISQ